MSAGKAIFFDLDGTLFDTRADLAATVNHTRRDLGLAEKPLEEVVACVGRGARYLLAHAIPDGGRPFEELWPVFRSHYAEHCCETLAPYPGVEATLAELKRRGWQLGINTSKPNFAVGLILRRFGWTDLFGAGVVAGGDCEELKPSALPLRRCAERIGHELGGGDWMVGDSWTDLGCAAAAGVKAAFCAFGFGERRDYPADLVLGSFADLLKLGSGFVL